MIKTVTENWEMKPLTNRDKYANGLSSLLTLNEPRPKSDCPNSLKIANTPEIVVDNLTAEAIANLDKTPLAESGNIIGFLQIAHKLDFELSTQLEKDKEKIIGIAENLLTAGHARNYINSVLEKLRLVKK
jgi:hypothetical protein